MILKQLIRTKHFLGGNANNPVKRVNLKNISQLSTISEWVRKFMNRIRYEDNRAI